MKTYTKQTDFCVNVFTEKVPNKVLNASLVHSANKTLTGDSSYTEQGRKVVYNRWTGTVEWNGGME